MLANNDEEERSSSERKPRPKSGAPRSSKQFKALQDNLNVQLFVVTDEAGRTASSNRTPRILRAKIDYSVVPWCTYTAPEIARVGLNESEAKQQSISYDLICVRINE
jgi:hypothetical protein